MGTTTDSTSSRTSALTGTPLADPAGLMCTSSDKDETMGSGDSREIAMWTI